MDERNHKTNIENNLSDGSVDCPFSCGSSVSAKSSSWRSKFFVAGTPVDDTDGGLLNWARIFLITKARDAKYLHQQRDSIRTPYGRKWNVIIVGSGFGLKKKYNRFRFLKPIKQMFRFITAHKNIQLRKSLLIAQKEFFK